MQWRVNIQCVSPTRCHIRVMVCSVELALLKYDLLSVARLSVGVFVI